MFLLCDILVTAFHMYLTLISIRLKFYSWSRTLPTFWPWPFQMFRCIHCLATMIYRLLTSNLEELTVTMLTSLKKLDGNVSWPHLNWILLSKVPLSSCC